MSKSQNVSPATVGSEQGSIREHGNDTEYICPSVDSERGSSKLAIDKKIIAEFKNNQNDSSNIPIITNNRLLDSLLTESSPIIALQEKIEYYFGSLLSSTGSNNNFIESFPNDSSETREKVKKNLFNDVSTPSDIQVIDQCINDKNNLENFQDHVSEQTFTDFMSSGSNYIPSESSNSFSDDDSEKTLRYVNPQVQIINETKNKEVSLQNNQYYNYNENNNYLVSSENGLAPKKIVEELKNKCNENNMTIASRQRENEPMRSEKSGVKVLGFDKEKDLCPFCFEQVGHFSRHLFRNHSDEESVRMILDMPIKSNDRRSAIVLLRRKGNFIMRTEKNIVRPTRKNRFNEEDESSAKNYSVCVNCFGNFKNSYLWRHRKICKSKQENLNTKSRISYRSESQTFLVATGLLGNFLSKSRILQVLNMMRTDNIGLASRTDPLICSYGESLLGKHKRRQIFLVVSQKMRIMAKLKLTLQKTTTMSTFMDILKPEMYDYIIAAAKVVAGYDPESLTFKSPSVGLHMGTDLKFICDVAKKAIITKNPLFDLRDRQKKLEDINSLRDMIISHWCNDLSSLANKVLNEKRVTKPQLLPLTEDVKMFNSYTSTMAQNAFQALLISKNIIENYRTLAQCTLALLLTFNRKRIGEIQYLDIQTYEQTFTVVNQEELMSCLTEFEKSMSSAFKRVIVFGKGSKPVPILFTKRLQQYTDCLIHIRRTTNIVPKTNKYIFANPDSDRWIAGTSVLRKLAKDSGAKCPELLTSTRFRKQIATILQVMSFEKDEMHQIAKFMGHTEKTHLEFYRLSEDIYQTAKVAKLLLLLNAGKGNEFKGKSLADIEITDDVLNIDEPRRAISTSTQNCEKSLELISELDETENLREMMDNEEIPSTSKCLKDKRNPKIVSKRRLRWSKEEKQIVLSYFKKHVQERRPPKKQECLNFISTYPDKFNACDWVRIKTLVFNTYRV